MLKNVTERRKSLMVPVFTVDQDVALLVPSSRSELFGKLC